LVLPACQTEAWLPGPPAHGTPHLGPLSPWSVTPPLYLVHATAPLFQMRESKVKTDPMTPLKVTQGEDNWHLTRTQVPPTAKPLLCAPSHGQRRFSVCTRLRVPCALRPTLLPADSHQLKNLIFSPLGPLTQKVIKTHLKNKRKSFNPHPETKHPSHRCHKQANVKSLSGRLSEGNQLMMKTFCS